MTFDQLIGQRLLALRQANHLSMADLALLSGVSKAMISKIEGGDCSASANILGRLAAALGVPLTQLLAKEDAPTQRLKTRASQELWSDPEAGYLRRQVVTRDAHSGIEMIEVELATGSRLSYPPWSGTPYRQRLWLLVGSLAVEYGADRYELESGDCLDYSVDLSTALEVLGAGPCRYLLVISPQ